MRAALAVLLLAAGPALAQDKTPNPPCADLASAQRALAEHMGEHAVAAGMAGTTALVLLLSETGGFTMLAVGEDGTACIAAVGEAWHDLPKRHAAEPGP